MENNSTKLKLCANSTRRAKWFETLGYQKRPVFPISLSSILPNGGPITFLDLIITRQFPLLYYEKTSNGNVIRTTTEEDEARREWQLKFELAFSEAHNVYDKTPESLDISSGHPDCIRQALIDFAEEKVPRRKVSVCASFEVRDHPPSKELCSKFALLKFWCNDDIGFDSLVEGGRYKVHWR